MQRISLLVAISASIAACAHRAAIPPLAAVEDEPPIRWPLRPLSPLPSTARAGDLTLDLDPRGEIIVRSEGRPEVRYRRDDGSSVAGTSLDRGYMKRFAWIEEGVFERYVEVFRGSPIVSIFPRIHSGSIGAHSFEIPDRLTEMIAFEGGAPVIGPRRTVTLDPSRTEKPIVVLRAPDDREGVLFFFPHRPEIRRWYVEDYVVTSTLSARIEATSNAIEIGFSEVTLPRSPRMSFDFPIYVMPYRGSMEEALEEFRIGPGDLDYWEPRDREDVALGYRQGGLRMLRYYPTEFSSWIDSTNYTYGHLGGYAWGNMTTSMKGVVTDPLDPRALLRDQAFRVLTFFIEAGGEKGAPPNLTMHPQWTTQMSDPNDIRTIVFCQYWEFRLREFEWLFDSPNLTMDEKLALYDGLQSARNVFDPEADGFAKATPNGGVWFDYLDLPISDRIEWIINTHTTNLANVGKFARLARKMGREDDYRYWRRLFLAGLKGQEFALAQDWMWAAADPNELRYSKNGNGPQSYHFYMLLVWVPELIKLAQELAPDRVPGLMTLMKRLMKAKFIAGDEKTLERARAVLVELEADIR